MKTIVVTGASRGIGFDTALLLCKGKYRVIAVARSTSGLEALYNEARKNGCAEHLVVIQADLALEENIIQLYNRIAEVTPVVDILINNAGTLVNKPFEEITRTELEMVYQVNVFGPFSLTKAMLPLLRKSDSAHVVNIGSVGGINGSSKFPGLTAYSSSKGALGILTEVLAAELTQDSIRVNCLALGAAQTTMLEEAFPGYKAPVSSEQMAEYIVWFAINGHRFFNGKVLPVALSTP